MNTNHSKEGDGRKLLDRLNLATGFPFFRNLIAAKGAL